jgi:microcystin-dependent protein
MSEIRIMSFGFAPKGWAQCNGQFLPINQNQALFSLLGTTYGGDGRTNFALPNLQGRAPTHQGNGMTLGQSGGEQNHTLSLAELPSHSHALQGSSTSTSATASAIPTTRYLGGENNLYFAPSNLTAMSPSSVSFVGGGQPHPNMQPYLTLNFCIALQGIFPSQN